jgi:hypothetical protein
MIGGLFSLFASRGSSLVAARIAERPEGALGDCFPHVVLEGGCHARMPNTAPRGQKTGKCPSTTGNYR